MLAKNASGNLEWVTTVILLPTRGDFGVKPPLSLIFYKTLLLAQRR